MFVNRKTMIFDHLGGSQLTRWSEDVSPSGVDDKALAKNGFQCFLSIKECFLLRFFVITCRPVKRRLLVEKPQHLIV